MKNTIFMIYESCKWMKFCPEHWSKVKRYLLISAYFGILASNSTSNLRGHQGEVLVSCMGRVLHYVCGLTKTPAFMQDLECWQLCSNDVLGRLDDPLEGVPISSSAAGKPQQRVVCQDALNTAATKGHKRFLGQSGFFFKCSSEST